MELWGNGLRARCVTDRIILLYWKLVVEFREFVGQEPINTVYLAPYCVALYGLRQTHSYWGATQIFCSSLYRNTWTSRFYKETYCKTSNTDKVVSFQPLFVKK